MTIRAIGAFSATNNAYEDKNSKLVKDVREALGKRPYGFVCIYIRKSDSSGQKVRANYLIEQQQIAKRLIDAGIPADRIRVFFENPGKKGDWSRKFREELDGLFDLVGEEEVACVIALDVARLFRDIWAIESSQFAARMARCHTPLMTTHNDQWHYLDFEGEGHSTFRELAHQAGVDRINIRSRTMKSKEISVTSGNYAGGPTPLGWAATARVSSYETEDGNEQAPQIAVYQPHAEYRIRVKEISLLPIITTVTALRRYLILHDITCPPFDSATAKEAFTRSGLSRMRRRVRTDDGVRIERLAEKPFVPSVKTLWGILLDPLDIGVRLYGSGQSGKNLLKKQKKMADEMDKPCDSMIRPGKVFVECFPHLAVCKTDDERDLFFSVWHKWGHTDIEQLIESDWKTEKPNPHQRAGKPVITRTDYKPNNPWAWRVYCLRHQDLDGNLADTHRMAIHNSGTAWLCYRDYQRGEGDICSTWSGIGKDGKCVLTRILNTHLLRTIRNALDNDAEFIQPLVKEEAGRLKYIAKLEAEEKETAGYLQFQTEAYAKLAKSLTASSATTFQGLLSDYLKENVEPLGTKLTTIRTDLAKAKAKAKVGKSGNNTVPDERRVRDMLHNRADNWDNLPIEDKMYLVDTLVDRVGVVVGDGNSVREGMVTIKWKTGRTDQLISWRSRTHDNEPFTTEEDNAIKRLWPAESGATWEDIQALVLPTRKFSTVRRRARELKVAKGAKRSVVWIAECMQGELCWGDDHPEILYLQVSKNAEGYCLAVLQDGNTADEQIVIPKSVRTNLQTLHSTTLCTPTRPGS